ncbi:phage major tail protein, TP901-1 family [Methylopila sp. 73B]|uniref:phage major tail protein, TP901-1 family n=1 Tax=Methylopila sp. 73B TaxID=1120792 RepID=UPI0005649EF5|nr:phage major tail protein, TP901-1 family [Methylopila sp. 73B]
MKGRDVLLKLNTVSTTFVTVGGAREATITINNEAVDVTSSDDAGIRKLLEGAGVNSISVKMSGVYIDDAPSTAIRSAAMTNAHKKFQIVMPKTSGTYVYEGLFMIASLEEAGTYNGMITYSLTLESAGAVTLT